MKRLLTVLAGLTAASFVATATPTCYNGGLGYNIYSEVVTSNATVSGNGDFAGGNSCTVGNYVFSNFQVAPNTGFSSGTFFLNVSVGSDSAPGTGLIISTNMSAALGQDIELEFSVTNGLTGLTLSVGPSGSVNEVVCSNQMNIGNEVNPGSCGAVGGTTLGGASVAASGSTTFLIQPAATDWIFKDISGASELAQTLVPEPMTLSLMGVGLLGLGIFGRRRLSK